MLAGVLNQTATFYCGDISIQDIIGNIIIIEKCLKNNYKLMNIHKYVTLFSYLGRNIEK